MTESNMENIIEPYIHKYEIGLEFICLLYRQSMITDAYIVGSVAEGTARKDSDIDIIIINPSFGEHIDFFTLQKTMEEEPKEIFEEVISRFDHTVRKTVEYLKNVGIEIKEFPFGNTTVAFQTYRGEMIDLIGYDGKTPFLLDADSIRIKKDDCIFEEIKKLFNLKITQFVVDETLPDSECDKYSEENVICHIKKIEDSIHEGVHAFFAERERKLINDLDKEYWDRLDTIADENLEEVTARIIESNIKKNEIDVCPMDAQKKVGKQINEMILLYPEDQELGKRILRLYASMYDFRCTCPEDMKLYNEMKNDIDPIVVYNKLARYVETKEIIYSS